MITFFKRLREKFLQSGQVSRYLLYAVGEILLVVIGILIALQVNNWNEERRNQQKSVQYHQRLLEEAEASLQESRDNIESDRADFEIARTSLEALKRGELLSEEKGAFDTFMFNYFKFQLNVDNLNTFTEMLSAGELELIRNLELRNMLADFVDLRTFHIEVHQTFHSTSHYKSEALDQYLLYEFTAVPEDSAFSQANQRVHYDFEAMASDTLLIRKISRQVYLWHESVRLQEYYKSQTELVYNKIKAELKAME